MALKYYRKPMKGVALMTCVAGPYCYWRGVALIKCVCTCYGRGIFLERLP